VAAALAKRACTRKRCSTEGEAARVLVGVVTAAARKGAKDLARSRERKEAQPTRLVDAARWRQCRRLEVVGGSPATASARKSDGINMGREKEGETETGSVSKRFVSSPGR
jgi:hypothetical protein